MTTTTAPITHTQDAIYDRLAHHTRAGDQLRAKVLTHALTRHTVRDRMSIDGDVSLDHFPETERTRDEVLDDALAAWDITLNAVRNVAGTLLETSEWLWLLGHHDAHDSLLTDQGTATRAYHEMCGEVAAAVAATHACDPVLHVVERAVGLASEPVTPDDVYSLLIDNGTDPDPKTRVLVRLALVVLADNGTIRESEPGKYLPAQ